MNEKRRFILMSAAVIACFVVLTVIVFRSKLEQFLSTRTQIEEMNTKLKERDFGDGEGPLLHQVISEKKTQEFLEDRWRATKSRLGTFSAFFAENQKVRDIDYNARIADACEHLPRNAAGVSLQIPHDLGMPKEVNGGADTTTLMMQLKVVSTIVEIATRERVPGRIAAIEPLPPVPHTLKNTKTPYFTEFPVRVEIETEMEPLLKFIYRLSNDPSLLAVRGLRIDKKVPDENTPQFVNEQNPKLRAVLILEALIVSKDPEKIQGVAPPPAPPKNLQPEGF